MFRILTLLAFGTCLSACDGLFQGSCSDEDEDEAEASGSHLDGKWEIELVDADDCQIDLDIEQDGDDLEGEADINCVLFYEYYGEVWSYEMEHDGVDLTGEVDGEDFEIELEFYDEYFDEDLEFVLVGEVEDDEMDGDAELSGTDFGEFEGSR